MTPESPPSKSLLERAHDAINGPRAVCYGDAKDGLGNVAHQWAVYIHQKYGVTVSLEAADVCWMMSDLKKVRAMTSQQYDNPMDAAGYIGLIEKVTVLK